MCIVSSRALACSQQHPVAAWSVYIFSCDNNSSCEFGLRKSSSSDLLASGFRCKWDHCGYHLSLAHKACFTGANRTCLDGRSISVLSIGVLSCAVAVAGAGWLSRASAHLRLLVLPFVLVWQPRGQVWEHTGVLQQPLCAVLTAANCLPASLNSTSYLIAFQMYC
jgi:hypothetical protein